MELRHYWKLLRRRWLFAVLPAVIVLGLGLATYRSPAPVYNVGIRFLVGQEPGSVARGESDEERYYNWTTSEYIVNGLQDWASGGAFAAAVSRELAERGREIPAGAIRGSISADNARSTLLLSMTFGDAAALADMIDAAAAVLAEQNTAALPQLGGEPALLVQLDEPVVNQIPAGLRSQLDLPLRVLLALAAGLGLALLVEYLDPTIRDRDDLALVDVPLLGEIPKK